MAQDTKPSMPAAPRHVYGPRPVSLLIPAVTRAAYRRRAPATAQVLADWESIVGPALGRITVPRRLHGGTLSVGCAGPVAMELQHMALEVVTRINTHVGRPVVRSLRFIQVGAFPRAPAPPSPSPQTVAAAEAMVAGLPEGELRSALIALGSAVLAERKAPTRRPTHR